MQFKGQLQKVYYPSVRKPFLLVVLSFLVFLHVVRLAQGVNLDHMLQVVNLKFGPAGGAAAKEWHAALQTFRSGSESQRLKDINEYFNRRIRFEDDMRVWGVSDYWATPIEMYLKGAGDCEDFAIAKYFSLIDIGVPVAKLRMTYVKARIGGPSSNVTQAHMVLTYYPEPDAEPLVLDNLISEIRPASRRTDLIPIFSFSSEGLWVAGARESSKGGSGNLSKWKDLLAKLQSEGFE